MDGVQTVTARWISSVTGCPVSVFVGHVIIGGESAARHAIADTWADS